ncbi:uncharacterized protein [Mytilus edulis]|uniref:uncharacterized protein n=1 Tax=Mytilus edulis TaxID=6550 RepID=UPI0039EFAB3A
MGKYIMWMTLFAFVRNMECVKAHNFPSDPAYHADRQTWQVASDRCGNNGLEFDERVLRNIAILQDKEFWIGIAIYRITTPWIETIGCYEMPDGPEIKKSPSIVLCKKRCETYQFFGYSESTENCFCQHNESSSFNLSHCIDNNDSKYSFVYKVFTGHVSDNGDGKCTTLSCRPGSNGLKSADCDASDYLRSSRCEFDIFKKNLLGKVSCTVTIDFIIVA